MNNRKLLMVFGAFLLAVALSLVVRLLDDAKEMERHNSKDASSTSGR